MNRQSASTCGISIFTPGVIPEDLRPQFGNACELVCIQVPKVYDSCLLKLCLVGERDKEDPDQGIEFDADLRVKIDCNADSVVNARVVGMVPGSFKVIKKRPVPGDPDKKFISFTYQLKILYDIVFEDGTISRDNELLLRRSETIGPLYCPDQIAIIRERRVDQSGEEGPEIDTDDEIVKIEIVARVLDVKVERDDCDTCDPYDDICFAIFTVGIFNIIKCELIVQLVVPAFGFCPLPAPCEPVIGEPCEIFNAEVPPAFFPPQLDTPIMGPGIGCNS
ncbi:MAG: hypothetical protein N4A62_19115 [Marinisporobacter sp.]|jgi:hypothetical protein|nr:hypothetical protein [Marinisporobacter sp.]